jgi:hypothetical protein
MNSEGKHLLKSRTFWVNLVTLIVVLAGMAGRPIVVSPQEQGALVAGVLALVNIWLRTVTREPVRV